MFAAVVVGVVVEVLAGLWVADRIGAGATILLILATSALGSVLLRQVTARGLARVRRAAAEGRPPGREAVDTLNGLAGALLITVPGLVSTGLGLILLAPPLRPLARAVEARLIRRRFPGVRLYGAVFSPGGDAADGTVVDGTVVEGEVLEEHVEGLERRHPPLP